MIFSGYEKRALALLACVQFTVVLDFMVLSPLGAVLMPALHISPAQFGNVVSAYAFSAGAAGLLAAGFADLFDRKRILLFFYGGFLLGTLACGMAASYHALLLARVVTGLFGGVMSSIIMAIATDLFAANVRGRVMAVIQTAFGVSQIAGIPVALALTNHFNWHAPFFLIVGMGLALGVALAGGLQPVNAHLQQKRGQHPMAHLLRTLSRRRHMRGFATTALMSTGAFMLMPFGSAFSVNNCGIHVTDLPTLYLASGVFSIFTAPFVGKATDLWGKYRVFVVGSMLMLIMVNLYTRLGVTPLWGMVIISALMFIGVQTRMISAFALLSSVPAAEDRGAYMAVQSSVQQVAGGIAAGVAGMLVTQPDGGPLLHFERVGAVITCTVVLSVLVLASIDRMVASPESLHLSAEGC